ncbi:MAG: HAD family hydrolase [Victivallaceae bacterium]|nr:HAD family hydrolase [Victivallaceae bacterium]
MKSGIKVIAFDADDTLWENQPHFDEIINAFSDILEPYCPPAKSRKTIHKIQVENLPVYGFGARSLALSMVQAACQLSDYRIDAVSIEKIIQLGRKLLTMPVKLLDSAEEVMKQLKDKYRLILITKGDLMEQERKLRDSGLLEYFHHIEILSDKKVRDYRNLFKRLNLKPEEFIMVGNSLRSDIIPVLELNAGAVYIPYPGTWEHEHVENYDCGHEKLMKIDKLSELPGILAKQE